MSEGEEHDVYSDEERVVIGLVTIVFSCGDLVGIVTEGNGRDLCKMKGRGWGRSIIGTVTARENYNRYRDYGNQTSRD